jgi:hypothetical protein
VSTKAILPQGVTYYDGELPVVASGTVPFNTYDKTGTQTFTIAVTAPLCGPGQDKDCCTAKGNPDDGTITLVCQKISPTEIIDNQTFSYDICEEKTVDVPWSFNGSGHYAGNVPYSGTVDYSGTTSCEYKEYAATDVLYNEGSVVIDCPDDGDVQTQEVTFRELVTNAHVGDHIEIEATGWTAAEKMISHRIIVKYAAPGTSIYSLVTRSDRTQLVANGIFKVNLEGGLTFDKAGTYQIMFKVWKPNGVLAGKAVTRTVIVAE